MEFNDIAVRPARRTVIIRDNLYQYGSSGTKSPHTAVGRAVVLRAPRLLPPFGLVSFSK